MKNERLWAVAVVAADDVLCSLWRRDLGLVAAGCAMLLVGCSAVCDGLAS